MKDLFFSLSQRYHITNNIGLFNHLAKAMRLDFACWRMQRVGFCFDDVYMP